MSGDLPAGLEPLFDRLQDGVCLADGKGNVLYANPAARRLLGTSAAEIAERPLCELLCGSLEGPCGPASACALRDPGSPEDAVTFSGRERRSGRDVRVRGLRARGGHEVHFLLIEDASADAEASRRQEEWRQMLVHDLRVPVTVALGILREMEDRGEGYPLSHQDLEILGVGARACRRMESLIEAYLEAARLEAGAMPVHPGRVDAGRLVLDCVGEQSEEARGLGLELSSSAPESLDAVADPDLLRRALMNLIGNALKFTPRGGRVRVEAARAPGSVLLRVTDTGPGIADADLSHIFDRFYRGRDGKHGGLGLGLTFCRAAMRAMGGEVSVETAPGKGSAFTLKIPAAGGAP